jgi:hypothetical protein
VRSEIENRAHFLSYQTVIEIEDLVDAEAVMQILEGDDRHPCAAKNPRAAQCLRHASDRRTL